MTANDIEYFTNINLKGNMIKNVVVDVVSAEPGSGGSSGQIVSYEGKLYISNGSEYKQLAIGGDVSTLTTRVTTLEGKVGVNSSGTETGTGLIKDVSDLKTTVGDSSSGLVQKVDALETSVGTDDTSGLRKRVKTIEDAPYLAGTAYTDGTFATTTSDSSFTSSKAVETFVNSKVAGVFRFKGVVTDVEELKDKEMGKDVFEGDVYNVYNAFEYDGNKFPPGTNVVCTEHGTQPTGWKAKWDVLGGAIDTSLFQTVANKVTAFQSTPDDTHYPSEKLVKDSLDTKQATITGGATSIVSDDLAVGMALVSNSSGKVAVSAVNATELGYVSGVTSAIQTQMDTKYEFANIAVTTTEGSATKSTAVYSKAKADELLATKVNVETGKRLMTDAEGTKLEGIATGAQVNVIEGVKLSDSATVITPADKIVTIPLAKTDADGLMSAEDKVIIDGIEAGAQVNVIEVIKIGSGTTEKTFTVGSGTKVASLSQADARIALDVSNVVNKGMDSSVTSGSDNYVSSGAVYTALTDGTVTKVGTTSVGSATQFMYLSNGTPTACASGVGGTDTPIYIASNGTITALTGTLANNISGNAGTATKLASARTIALSGAVTGTATSFDGSGNITIPTTAVDPTMISAGTAGINVSGTAGSLASAQNFSIKGGATASAISFDGTGAVELDVTALDASKISAGTIGASYLPWEMKTKSISGSTATISEFPYGLLVLDNSGNVVQCHVQYASNATTLSFSQSFTGTAYYIGLKSTS